MRIKTLQRGFTLIELLVVISIIGTLVGLIVNNLSDSRARARDIKRKSDVNQLKTALRLYYNDYQVYPEGTGFYLKGCGATGTDNCTAGGEFSAGSGPTIYMKQLPANINYQSAGADDYILKITLENASDADITTSQTNCPGGSYAQTEYIVCAD
jgi:prepilin-type N-terminal cleavage/methylation domain-containing protein